MLKILLSYEQKERVKKLYPKEMGVIISRYFDGEDEGIKLMEELGIELKNYPSKE